MTLFLFTGAVLADGPGVILSFHAASDFELTAGPDAKLWRGIKGVFMDSGRQSEPVPGHRTEIRSRWTKQNLWVPKKGLEMRLNFYRIQGPPPDRKFLAWQPTGSPNNHVPEAFGRLRME